MADCVKIPVESGELNEALGRFFGGLLEKDIVQGVFVPMRQPGGNVVMPTLVREPGNLKGLDPLAPVTATSAARALCSITSKEAGFRIGALLRPCDFRAYVELIKLKQAFRDQVLVITMDCLGRLETKHFLALAEEHGDRASLEFQKGQGKMNGFPLLRACEVCEIPSHDGSDIAIRLLGVDLEKEVVLCGQTEEGEKALQALGFEGTGEPAGREQALKDLVAARKAEQAAMFEEFGKKASSFAGLRDLMGTCINCYNCRVACPVCYCKECVFVTDTFRHEPEQYFHWAEKRGRVKIPTDTLFFHVTRMLHMSTLCVGCGQCSTACPMDLPVMEVFRAMAARTQPRFQYEPGRSLEDPLPLSVFEDQEFLDVAGD
jgi:formate dehydrogenase subunit beta